MINFKRFFHKRKPDVEETKASRVTRAEGLRKDAKYELEKALEQLRSKRNSSPNAINH